MSRKKKLQNEILSLDQDIQAAHIKVKALDRHIRGKQNISLEQSLVQTESYENTVANAAKSFLEEVLNKAQADILSALSGTGLLTSSWKDKEWGTLSLPLETQPPEFLRIGELIPDGIASSLSPIPALLPLVKHHHVVVFNSRKEFSSGINLQSSITWRILASSSPQSYRISFIDTIDRGRSFAAFLSLPELIRGEKIYCDSKEIEDSLSKLVHEMDDVIQNRLRENYDSIEGYNAANPKTTIPYHFIVFSAFPDGFSEQSLEYLISIARSGPRAGFYLIGNALTGENKFHENHISKLIDSASCIFIENETRAQWDDPQFAHIPIKLDGLPSKDLSELIASLILDDLQKVSDIVELMEFIPDAKNWWTVSSQHGVSAPLGLNNKGKVFSIELGPQKDAFHALVGGRIHSGKTNFLHALVLSLCTNYSPEELELYLVDFKEGVEFQDYAALQLPHAGAIVIEAEREFGLSVLEYLRDEMSRRSELFKASGVSDVKIENYRQTTGQKIPRIIAIFDEFVKLFEEDDQISAEAYKIMIEIAQRSRAFGIHLVLASQRPTASSHNLNNIKSQINLRVAFKCNDLDDSMLILGERNDKAALLEHLGIACVTYDPNLLHITDKVNVAYVRKDDRHLLLGMLQKLSKNNYGEEKLPPIIFNKREPVFWINNPQVVKALHASIDSTDKPTVWLGQPVRLATDRGVSIIDQESENILLMGHNDQFAFQTLVHSLISLALTSQPDRTEFYWLAAHNSFPNAAEYLDEMKSVLPHALEIGAHGSAQALLNEIIQRMEHRIEQRDELVQIFLFVPGMHRIPEFRNADLSDDPKLGEMLEKILQGGSQSGIHTVVWADRYDTLRNSTSYGAIDTFNNRVAFHLTTDDSNSLLGVSDASRLGTDRRLLYRNQKWAERAVDKIKPYDLPTIPEFRIVLQHIRNRWEN